MVYGRYNELVNGIYTPTFTSLGGTIPRTVAPFAQFEGAQDAVSAFAAEEAAARSAAAGRG